jgi:hypothetical protein
LRHSVGMAQPKITTLQVQNHLVTFTDVVEVWAETATDKEKVEFFVLVTGDMMQALGDWDDKTETFKKQAAKAGS